MRDYAALEGRPVTEKIRRHCAENGHATHIVDNVEQETCPCCGDVLTWFGEDRETSSTSKCKHCQAEIWQDERGNWIDVSAGEPWDLECTRGLDLDLYHSPDYGPTCERPGCKAPRSCTHSIAETTQILKLRDAMVAAGELNPEAPEFPARVRELATLTPEQVLELLAEWTAAARYRDHGDRADLIICGDCSTRATLCVLDRDEIGEHNTLHAYFNLRKAWEDAKAADLELDTPKTSKREQTTYDALIDFVEENGLNYSAWDPRGPLEDASKTSGWVGPDARLHP